MAGPPQRATQPHQSPRCSLLLLLTAGLAVLATTALSTFGSSGPSSLGPVIKVLILLASVLVNAGVFLLAFRIATARDV